MTNNPKIKVTLIKSTIGKIDSHKACVKGLGLRRIGHSVVLENSPAIRGMISKVNYLLRVEELAKQASDHRHERVDSGTNSDPSVQEKTTTDNWLGGLNWIDYFNLNGAPGGADILCGGATNIEKRIGELAYVLLFLRDSDGNSAYSNLVVLLPPNSSISKSYIREFARRTTLERTDGFSVDEIRRVLAQFIEFSNAENLTSTSIAEIVLSSKKRSFIYVVEGSQYRNPTLQIKANGKTLTEEDIWTPHLVSLADECSKVTKVNEPCVLVDAGKYYPLRPSNIELLTSLDQCGVMGIEAPADEPGDIVDFIDKWISDVKGGQKDRVLQEIDSCPLLNDKHKQLSKIQVLNSAGYVDHAVQLIRSEVDKGNTFDAENRVSLASISVQDPELSRKLLLNTISEITSQERLEQALRVCSKLSLSKSEKECVQKLSLYYPHSLGLRVHEFSSLLVACKRLNGNNNAIEKSSISMHGDFSHFLLNTLQQESCPDYEKILNATSENWPNYLEQARLCCALHAADRDNFSLSIRLARPDKLTGDFARHAVNILLWSVESFILKRCETDHELKLLESAILNVLSYLAARPDDSGVRGRLSSVMSFQSSEFKGLAILAKVILTSIKNGDEFIDGERENTDKASEKDFVTFLETAMKEMSLCGGIYLGESVLSESLLVPSADELLQSTLHMVNVMEIDEDNMPLLQNLVAIGCAIAPQSNRPNSDIDLVRMAANRMYLAGRVQQARDYAEHALTITKNDQLRARLAWHAYSEIYHRGQNHIESLIGLACALSSPAKVTKEQGFYEIYGIIRVFRDLGMIDMAMSLLNTCELIFKDLDLDKTKKYRLDTISIGIRMKQVMQTEPVDAGAISKLADEAGENLKAVLDNHDELLPIATLTSQIIRYSKEHNIDLSPDIQELLDSVVAVTGPKASSFIQVLGNATPQSEDLFSLVKATESARFSEDIAYDINLLVLTSRRLLASKEAVENSMVATFAGEITTDLSISLPPSQSKDSEACGWLPASIEVPADQLTEISRLGLDITLLALNSNDQLIRVTAHDGILSPMVCEPASVFSMEKYRKWLEHYPYDYIDSKDDPNIFYTSTDGLGISQAKSEKNVFILDTQLQQLSPNLIRSGNDLIGFNTKVAIAPSINWLYSAMKDTVTTVLPPQAWISTATSEESNGTLQIVAERLEQTLNQYDIPLNTDAAIPTNMEGAELAIVAAHGGLNSDQKFFRAISDEDALKLNPVTLSRALSNVGVAILFICSGGRFDKHPLASTTIALPKELLDSGCSAVIGSPWPLDARVPSHWLPKFLESWNAGDTLIDANWKANKAVEAAMGSPIEYHLAMTIYGNPFLKRST